MARKLSFAIKEIRFNLNKSRTNEKAQEPMMAFIEVDVISDEYELANMAIQLEGKDAIALHFAAKEFVEKKLLKFLS